MSDRLARLALSMCREPGDLWLSESLKVTTAEELHDHLRRPRSFTGAAAAAAARLVGVDPERELERGRRLGLRFVVPGDSEWVPRLDDLAFSAPHAGMGGPPVGLWLKGPAELSSLDRSVAIVGSRSATTYGCDVAATLAGQVAAAGWSVVSGGAFGIDVAAHRGCLGVGGSTVAVLACGADRTYPLEHDQLLRRIGDTALIISETIPGGAPFKARFLSRNRLIAALTRGTVVVEAAVRSGALNTATWAATLNRPVLGVPGPVSSAVSQGVHELMRNGQAGLVAHGDQVMEALAEIGELLPAPARGTDRPEDGLTGLQRRVLEATPARSPAVDSSIARVAGVDQGSASVALGDLLTLGLVAREGTGWRLARRPTMATGNS